MMEPTKHAYEKTPLDDYEQDHESNTQVDESLNGEDKMWLEKELHGSRRRRSGVLGFLQDYHWMINTSLLLIILGLVVHEQWKKKPVNEYQIGGDMTGVGPECEYNPHGYGKLGY